MGVNNKVSWVTLCCLSTPGGVEKATFVLIVKSVCPNESGNCLLGGDL